MHARFGKKKSLHSKHHSANFRHFFFFLIFLYIGISRLPRTITSRIKQTCCGIKRTIPDQPVHKCYAIFLEKWALHFNDEEFSEQLSQFSSFKTFQDISNIHSYNTRSSALNNFYTQSSRLSIQLNSFSRIGTTIWNEMPLTLRNFSKYDFKRKIKRVLFDILTSEDSHLDIRNIIQKVKFS